MSAKKMFKSGGFRYTPCGEITKIGGVLFREWMEHPEKDEDLSKRKYRNIPTDFTRTELIAVFNDYPCQRIEKNKK